MLSPTDPVVTSAIVASKGVPRAVRHTLNLESGLNDGLALPFVLLLLVLSPDGGGSLAGAGGSLALETVVGLAIGVGWGLLIAKLVGRLSAETIHPRYEGLLMLGVAAASYGIAELAHGNGLIAAFVAGVSFALLRHEAPDVFHERNENITNVLHLIAFAIFGAVVAEVGYSGGLVALAAFAGFALVVARPPSVLIAFYGLGMTRPERLFIAWFGPKNIASMLFALFVLHSDDPQRAALFEVAAFTVLASIIAHGLSDTVGAARIERRMAQAKLRARTDDGVCVLL